MALTTCRLGLLIISLAVCFVYVMLHVDSTANANVGEDAHPFVSQELRANVFVEILRSDAIVTHGQLLDILVRRQRSRQIHHLIGSRCGVSANRQSRTGIA